MAAMPFTTSKSPGQAATLVAVFHNSQARNTDTFGDTTHPEDDLIGIFLHTGPGPLRVTSL